VTRIVQIAGLASALVALYQLPTHSGLSINHQIRSNGTFVHPNGAAMYFAIALAASLWRYLDRGRRRSDLVFAALYGAAAIATFSLSGLAGLFAMLVAFGTLRSGSFRLKLGSYVLTAVLAVAFLATPLGAQRVANESATHFSTAQHGTSNTSLAWRLIKWRSLIPVWERNPVLGQGLGTTVSVEGTSENVTAGKVPHNEYVRYLVETGVVGLVALVWALALLLHNLKRRRGSPAMPDAATLALAVLIGCMVNGLADNTLLYTTTGYAVALIVAAALRLPRVAPQRSRTALAA
jgi:O-antigen ligase